MLSGATLGVEVCNGHVDVIEALKSCEKFKNIPAAGEYGLGRACNKAIESQSISSEALIQSYVNSQIKQS